MSTQMKPLASHCLIQQTKKEEQISKGGIIQLPIDPNFDEGIIIAIGNKLDSEKEQFDKDLEVGIKVLFDNRKIIYKTNDNQCLVRFDSIVALLDKKNISDKNKTFFEIPSYEEILDKKSNLWKDYLNIKSFEISSQFVTPFTSIEPIFKLNHEMVYETLNEIPGIEYRNILGSISEKKDKYSTIVDNDVWFGDYRFEISEKGLDFDFRKTNTDVENLCLTLPKLLIPYAGTMRSNHFQRFSELDFNKAKRLSISINQEIKLLGAGKLDDEIKNSEIMQQFLKLKTDEASQEKSLLGALAFNPEDIGRIDLNISFSKKIKNNLFTVFLYVKAPANDDNSLLDITWHIVDYTPGIIPDRNFGEIFSEFFIKTVIKGFYHRWFSVNKEVNVISLKK